MEIINYIIGIIFTGFMGWFCYMSFHINQEEKEGKYIPLPWEKDGFLRKTKRKTFDKADIQYRDGDNT